MCVSPQRRAIFRHQNFKKCSEKDSFLTFWLLNVLLATAACNFSTSKLQKVLRDRQFFSIFTAKCVFRHSGVQFLISPLSSYLRTRRFNRPTFGLTRHTNHWKHTAFGDFSNIWRGCIFFLLTFALLHLLSADLTTLLCFSTVHIVGSFYLNFLRWYDEVGFLLFLIHQLYCCFCWHSWSGERVKFESFGDRFGSTGRARLDNDEGLSERKGRGNPTFSSWDGAALVEVCRCSPWDQVTPLGLCLGGWACTQKWHPEKHRGRGCRGCQSFDWLPVSQRCNLAPQKPLANDRIPFWIFGAAILPWHDLRLPWD